MVLDKILSFNKFTDSSKLLHHVSLFTKFRDAVVHKAIGVSDSEINNFLVKQKSNTSLSEVVSIIEQSEYNIKKNIPKLIEKSISQKLT